MYGSSSRSVPQGAHCASKVCSDMMIQLHICMDSAQNLTRSASENFATDVPNPIWRFVGIEHYSKVLSHASRFPPPPLSRPCFQRICKTIGHSHARVGVGRRDNERLVAVTLPSAKPLTDPVSFFWRSRLHVSESGVGRCVIVCLVFD